MRSGHLGDIAAVASGGAIGAVMRVWFAVVFPVLPGRMPWTTFAENVSGAFALGVMTPLVVGAARAGGLKEAARRRVRLLVCTGVLGSFTTFSNMSVELVGLIGAGYGGLGVAYALTSVAAGVAAGVLGLLLGRRLVRGPRVDDGGAS